MPSRFTVTALLIPTCLLGAAFAFPYPARAQDAAAVPAATASQAQEPGSAPTQPSRTAFLPFPPWAEATEAAPLEPAGLQEFDAGAGALPQLTSPTFGPSSGLCVNLATGAETYVPAADIVVHNPTGSDVAFIRSFRSDCALRGFSSGGLSVGWVDNFDVVVVSPKPAWGDIYLIYPNGARDILRPEIGQDGHPTGKFAHLGGAPFLAQGVPSATITGRWDSITVQWTDGARWDFQAVADNACALARLDDLTLQWATGRRLTSVTGSRDGKVLLRLSYDGQGDLQTVQDCFGRRITYGFTTPPDESGLPATPVLMTVSTIFAADGPPPITKYTFGYNALNGKPLLHTVTVPSPTGHGFSTATIQYDGGGRVRAHVDAEGNQRLFTYGVGGTRVEIRDASGAMVQFWTQNIDELGRNIGITDALGHSTKLSYGK
jgi:hypothetical protein